MGHGNDARGKPGHNFREGEGDGGGLIELQFRSARSDGNRGCDIVHGEGGRGCSPTLSGDHNSARGCTCWHRGGDLGG